MVALDATTGLVPRRLEHVVPFRREGTYAPFPVVELLHDGRLALAFPSNDFDYQDHGFCYDWNVLVSGDDGMTWRAAAPDDLTIPFNWPGSGPREKWDRFAATMPDGTLVAAGAPGWLPWPASRRQEAEARGLQVGRHPSGDDGQIAVAENVVFVQRSRDGGRTWRRQEWQVPGAYRLTAFPRPATLASGTILLPLYDIHDPSTGGLRDRNLLLRSTDYGQTWALMLMGSDAAVGWGNEAALVETVPGRVLAMIRQNRPGYLLQSWSDDGGRTWSQPLRTSIWGYPPHLLKLRDGRVLCTYGHRRAPLGVQAVISVDGGLTWDVAHRAILRGDGEMRRRPDREGADLGYPVSVELTDGSIFTTYYLTKGQVTHIAATRWEVPWE